MLSKQTGTAFRDVKGKLYPAVGIKKAGETIRVNFGQNPFVFKIDQVVEVREQTTIAYYKHSRYASQCLGYTANSETHL